MGSTVPVPGKVRQQGADGKAGTRARLRHSGDLPASIGEAPRELLAGRPVARASSAGRPARLAGHAARHLQLATFDRQLQHGIRHGRRRRRPSPTAARRACRDILDRADAPRGNAGPPPPAACFRQYRLPVDDGLRRRKHRVPASAMTAVTRAGDTPSAHGEAVGGEPVSPASAARTPDAARGCCSAATRRRAGGYGAGRTGRARPLHQSWSPARKSAARTGLRCALPPGPRAPNARRPAAPGAIADVWTAGPGLRRCRGARARACVRRAACGLQEELHGDIDEGGGPPPDPVTATCPRASSLLSTPTRASAVRRPGTARSARSRRGPRWTERALRDRAGGAGPLSPTATLPLQSSR